MKPDTYLTYVIRWMWWHKQLVSEPRVATDKPTMTFRTFERRRNKAEWEKRNSTKHTHKKRYCAPCNTYTQHQPSAN